jgi:Carboxypeptidase regulatory-like domain
LKKALVVFSLLLLTAGFICAQEYGAIRGKVTDNEGNALPGVSVTLTGGKTAPRSLVTSAEGNFRFLNLPVASDYQIVLELTGFKTHTRSSLAVSYGRDIDLNIQMDQAALEEQVTVIGQTPVIDTKRTQVGVNITSEMIMRLPTARDPWVMMQLSPGMLIDRENVGGSDSGQQSGYYGHGSSSGDATWSVDGANITDNSALGAAPGYLNMAGFEEIMINYGNNDVRSQTGGVQLNFITRRGGNAFSGMIYVDASKKAWQSTNLPEGLPANYTGAGINKIYLYGANFGGPILKDKLWFYGSYGIQDLGTFGINGLADNTFLESGYFRLDAQMAKNTRANLFYEYDNKQKWGRTSWGAAQQAPETLYDQVGPTPIYKAEIEQMFGNLFLNAKIAYTHNTFHLIPRLGEVPNGGGYLIRDHQPEFYASGNNSDYNTVRPQTNASFTGNYFAENVLGADHEFKFGVDYVHSGVSSYSIYEGGLYIDRWADDDWAEAVIVRDYYNNYVFDRYSAFAQDTLSFGRLAVTLGLRYDIEKSVVSNVTQPEAPFLGQYLQELSIDTFDPGMRSKIFSPRLSLVYDLTGDGKNVFKLNAARYGTQTGYEFAGFLNPVPWAAIAVRWIDDGDGVVEANELFGTDFEGQSPNDPDGWSWFWGFDPENPDVAASTNKYDPAYKTPLLDELSFSYEREVVSDFAVRFELFYKKLHRFSLDRAILSDGTLETQDNYYLIDTEPITGSDYYGRDDYAIGSYRTNYVDGTLASDGSLTGATTLRKSYNRYIAGEIVLKKRLSHNWMLDGSFTLSNWKYFAGNDPSDWPYDLTNYDFYNGGVVAPQSGGSGISAVWVNARWMARLAGLYQFPYGIAASFAFQARDGYVTPPFVEVYQDEIGWTNLNANEPGNIGKFGDRRLPNFYELSLRLEKTFNVSDKLRFSVAGDCFNVFNSNTALEQLLNLEAGSLYGQTRRILNPRVFRAGVRVEF